MNAARRRSHKRRDLEPNLYEQNGYYRYRHPQTKKYHGMGKDKFKANLAARKLNAILISPSNQTHKVLSSTSPTFEKLLTRYRTERVPELSLTKNTLAELGYRLDHLQRDLHSWFLTDISVKAIADYLDTTYTNNAYIKHRGDLIQIFRWAMTKGLMETNPAKDTLPKKPAKKLRQHLSKNQYDSIYTVSDDWLQVAMDLALITLQREGDLVWLKYSDISDGYLHVIQQKTEKWGITSRLKIKIGSALNQVIERSKSLPPYDSPFIIHRIPKRKIPHADLEHWSQCSGEYLSKAFMKARNSLSEMISIEPRQRPTFHEIRALGGFLYEQRANTDRKAVQRLMGHTSEDMTSDYVDRHNLWTECDADLDI